MIVPFASGAQSQNSGSHEELPAVAYRATAPVTALSAVRLILKVAPRSADVLPERVRPMGEPTGESDSEPTGKARRKGPRRRGRDAFGRDLP